MKTIGVIGLGIIGSVWARHYESAGVLGAVWNRTAQPGFPRWRSTPEEVLRAVDIVQIVVADPPAVRGVLARIAPLLKKDQVVVQSSTIDPQSSDEFAATVAARGASYLEAPFTGSKPAAEAKKTVFYLGGASDLVQVLEPILGLVSETRFHIGTNRQATILKLAMNLNIAAQMQGLSEALTFARKAGISDDLFFSALGKNVSYSGLTKLKEPKLRERDFGPQFSVKHMSKDMRLAVGSHPGEGFSVLAAVCERLGAAEAAGFADEDFSALIKLLK